MESISLPLCYRLIMVLLLMSHQHDKADGAGGKNLAPTTTKITTKTTTTRPSTKSLTTKSSILPTTKSTALTTRRSLTTVVTLSTATQHPLYTTALPPNAPACRTTNQQTTSIVVSWNSVESADTYYVKHDADDTSADKVTTTTEITFNDLLPGSMYKFIVIAGGPGGNSSESFCTDTTYPDEPVITNVSAVTTSTITLSWSTGNTSVFNSTDVCYEDISITGQAICVSVSTASGGDEMSYTVFNLSPGRTYQFNVTVTSFSKSSTSTTVEQTTEPKPPNVTCSPVSSTELSLTLEPDGIADFFLITTLCSRERFPPQRCNTTLNVTYTGPSMSLNLTLTGLNAYKVYTFEVTAVKTAFVQYMSSLFGASNESQFRTSVPTAMNCTTSQNVSRTVRNFTIVNTAGLLQSVTLTWMSPLDPNGLIRQYYINYTCTATKQDQTQASDVKVVNATDILQPAVADVDDPDAAFKYDLADLKAGCTYGISIQAMSGAGLGDHVSLTWTTSPDSVSQIIMTSPEPPSSSNRTTAIVLGVLFPFLAIATLGGLLFFVWRRRVYQCQKEQMEMASRKIDLTKSVKRTSWLETTARQDTMPTSTVKPIPRNDFLERVKQMASNNNLDLSVEYEELKSVGVYQSTDAADLACNTSKNRYKNIKPYDVTRVTLLPINGVEGSDYINASWLPGLNSRRKFIAAQGPLPSTRDDFWRMIWEYNCRHVVMLTRCTENGRNKCEQYWPTHTEPVVYGDLQVALLKHEITETWHITELKITLGNCSRTIKHFHYQVWPDKEVPDETETLVEFVRLVQNDLAARRSPVVVHCSAGVGRTGTYIALDTLLHQMEHTSNEPPMIDVYGTVYRLRMNRVSMVQTEAQYIFIHNVIESQIAAYSAPSLCSDVAHEDLYQNQLEINKVNFDRSSITTEFDRKALL